MPQHRTVNKLSFKYAYILTNLVRDKYVASGQTDAEFAEANTAAVGHTLTASNVAAARSTLNIPNNNARPAPKLKLEDRVTALEAALAALQDALGVTRQ